MNYFIAALQGIGLAVLIAIVVSLAIFGLLSIIERGRK